MQAGQIAGARFRFKWSFCGTFESHGGPPVPIEAGGHWKYEDANGPWIEATFAAPGRAEGTVQAPSRMTPGCPATQATFVAEPGAAPFEEAETVVVKDVVSRRFAHEPKGMLIKRGGSIRFYGLHWRGFGEPLAQATGRAYLRSRGAETRRSASAPAGRAKVAQVR